MLPTYVGLVPLENRASPPIDRLRKVAAALQVQVVSDLGPVWGVTAVVSAFKRLEDLPLGYLPLALTTSTLPDQRRGFHFTMGGLPFAVVHYEENQDWTGAASHELLEMLCDPFAQRTALGPSLADRKNRELNPPRTAQASRTEVIKGHGGSYIEQGLVNYIVEVCDPCEGSTYEINGVTVSDFVTPGYYDTRGASVGPYSFLGGIRSQLGVLQGGCISWRALLPQTLVYKAEAAASRGTSLKEVPPARLQITKVVDGSPGLSAVSQRSPGRTATLGPSRPYGAKHTSWAAAGRSVRADLKALLEYLKYTTNHQPPTIDEIIALLEEITTAKGYNTFKANPQPKLKALGLTVDPSALKSVPTLDRYKEVLNYLKQQRKVAGLFGPDLSGEDTALWLCMQIG